MAALPDLRMPGVYTQEVPTLPPTVAIVQSAVPVFIGYTEKAKRKGEDLTNKAIRIKSMREYEEWFGGAKKVKIEVGVDERDTTKPPLVEIKKVTENKLKMHYALQLYYANGGGPCFIYSVGAYTADGGSPDANKFDISKKPKLEKALKLAKDITILLFPDAIGLDNYNTIISSALMHCEKMKNRVTIIDMENGGKVSSSVAEDATAFQGEMPSDTTLKKYGMAYYPFLETGLSYSYDSEYITISEYESPPSNPPSVDIEANKKIATDAKKEADEAHTDAVKAKNDFEGKLKVAIDAAKNAKKAKTEADKNPADSDLVKAAKDAEESANKAKNDADTADTAKKKAQEKADKAKESWVNAAKAANQLVGFSMKDLEISQNTLFNAIKDAIRRYPVTMPPSPAIAGIYVRTDATQGPWKAPANTGVYGTIKPSIELDDDDHATLNAPDNGKAINAIRDYPGRGILVYGARTLAGNDLEWRYVNVRRTFCFIEDTIARSMQDFVFASNNQQTWIKVRAMINAFLNRIWKAGGLYGATPEDAYEVLIGEPDTMTVEDVLSGIMRVVIRVAVVRPAEFIVLEYEHKFELSDN
jgi:phage tail sheath protein FI